MSGFWGSLDCPNCGHTHPPPAAPACDCDHLIADLICPQCHRGWELKVELWRYYGIQAELPSREQDR
jgi:hypothetical protein